MGTSNRYIFLYELKYTEYVCLKINFPIFSVFFLFKGIDLGYVRGCIYLLHNKGIKRVYFYVNIYCSQ